ncbi:SAM-dependent methyltransferase [Pseudoroseomonas cervicalis]|nr:SAM-dependent methyltransferase [Pseudoroseomonas cervicalis]
MPDALPSNPLPPSPARHTANAALFLRRWMANPLQMGSIVPSSPSLCRRIAERVQRGPQDYVLELGAGTGVLSRALLEQGVPPERLVVVEIVPDMAAHLRRTLPGVRVVCGDAFALADCIPAEAQGAHRHRHLRHPAGAAAAGTPARLPRQRRERGTGARLPALQLLHHLAPSLAEARAGGAARSLDTAQFPAGQRLALHAGGVDTKKGRGKSVPPAPPSFLSGPAAAGGRHQPCNGTSWARNCAAQACQEKPSARARHAARSIARARRQAARRSSSSAPTGASPSTVSGPASG